MSRATLNASKRVNLLKLLIAIVMVVASVATAAAEEAVASSEVVAEQPEDDGRRVAGTLRAGAEYDDNVFRAEGEDRVGGFLSRYFAALDLATASTGSSVASASFAHGGKFFFDNEHGAADTLLSQAQLGYRVRFVRPFGLFAQADLRDRTERILKRDYTTGGISGGVESQLGRMSLRAGGGGRFFAFKPNPEASSANIEGLASVGVEVVNGVTASIGYTIARRAFGTDRFVRDGEEVLAIRGDLRRDMFHTGRVGVAWRAKLLVAELSYSFAHNTSNSFGQGLTRHGVDLTVTAPLPWELFVSAHLELQRTTYDDQVRIDATFLVDEDNRNAGVLSLVRALGEHWEVEARYSVYLQEFGVGGAYTRQTIFLAGAYVFD